MAHSRRSTLSPFLATRPVAYDPRYDQAHRLYADLRRMAFARALEHSAATGLATPATRIAPIDRTALHVYAQTWAARRHWTGAGGWPWDLLVRSYLKKPRAFHAALWESNQLCGLAVGAVSKGRRRITLRYVQSAPDPEHPLRGRVMLLMLEAVKEYGLALGSESLVLRNPLAGVLRLYLDLGFVIAGKHHGMLYLSRPLE